jgi:hypothetical protein
MLAPLPSPDLYRLVASLHGPSVHLPMLERAVAAAASLLNAGRVAAADEVVAGLELPPVSYDGAALMKALGRRLGISPPNVEVGGSLSPSRPVLFDEIARVRDYKRATAQALQGLFVPGSGRLSKASPDDPDHPGWPTGAPDGRGGKFRPKDSADDTSAPADAKGRPRATLPPGEYRADLQDLLERIANAKPEEAAALRQEIRERYYDVGDITGGNALNQGLSEALEPGATLSDRQAVLESIAPYAVGNPESAAAIRDALLAVIGGMRQGRAGRFANRSLLQRHFEDHGADFGAATPEEYERQARTFLVGRPGPDTLQSTRNGDIIRFNPITNEFGVISQHGTIRTYYKPDPAEHGYSSNLDYFYAQQR